MAKLGTRVLSWLLALVVLASAVTPFALHTRRADAVVAGIVFTPGVLTVNSTTQYNVAFTIGQGLTAGVSTITITFPTGVVLPATIEKGRVSVNGIPLTIDPLVTPSTRVVVATVPATTPAGAANANIGCGADAICANADDPAATAVAVFFSQLAGITNPAAGGPAGTGAAASAGVVATSVEAAVNALVAVAYLRTMTHSPTNGARGASVTSTASGFVSGSTVTLWNDNGAGGGAAGDFIRNGGEAILGSAAVGTDGRATVSWVANVPPLAAGANAAIRAWDNAGNVAAIAGTAPAAGFTVNRRITLSPTSGPVGTTVTLTGQDFTAAEAIDGADGDLFVNEGITIATLACGSTVAGSLLVGATGVAVAATAGGTLPAATFCVIPVGVNTGTSTVRVFVAGGAASSATATFTVQGAPVTLTPSSGVPGTPVTISASGLTGGGAVAIGAITIGGVAWNVAAVALDAAGNMPATILNIPAAQAAGAFTVTVTDGAFLTGSATLTVPARTIQITPASSRRNSVVTVTGSGYSRNSSVTINYLTGVALPGPIAAGAAIGAAAGLTDANGNFTANLTVPTNAAINSTNTITAVDAAAPGAPANTNTVQHAVPAPTMSVTPASAALGASITITGGGFPAFTAMTALTIGGLGVLPAAAVNTDGDGAFTVSVVVPQQNTGTAAVAATIGAGAAAIVGTQNITVTAAVANVATQLQALTTGNNLQRAWAFDNATQKWKLFQPGAPAAVNDLTVLAAGDAVVIVVTSAATLTTGTFTQNLVAGTNIFGWR